jgi:uncharacterized C2H2 Zn-finger protein
METAMKFKEKAAQFMYGRRGTDELSRFLLAVTIVLIVLSWLTSGVVKNVLWVLGLVSLVYAYVRILSRDIYKRQQENAWYLQKKQAVLRWFQSVKDRWQQRKDYKFFRCPSCHTLLRVPKGKGKLLLTCRKCGNRFERKS